MVALELNFYPFDEARGHEWKQFDTQLEDFLCTLRGNGNIFDNWHILELDDKVQVRAMAPEAEALLRCNWSIYASGRLDELAILTSRHAIFEIVYEDCEHIFCCECKAPTCYLLASSELDVGMPVDCGDCALPIPLYRLPYLNGEEEHWTIRQWQRTYAALDALYIASYIGERFAFRHLWSAHSELSKWSLQITREWETKIGKPFYFDLRYADPKRGDKCPRCRRDWELETPWREGFLFRCQHCRLVAKEATCEPTPLSQLHP